MLNRLRTIIAVLAGVVALANSTGQAFGETPETGPLQHNEAPTRTPYELNTIQNAASQLFPFRNN